MKKLLWLFFVLFSLKLTAQPLRLHIKGGFANYTGDLQDKRFTLKQAGGLLSAGATFNLSNKFALRGDYSFTRIGADDKFSKSEGVVLRNLNFKTLIRELSLLGEYDLFDLYEKKWTPYIFAGVGLFNFSPYTTMDSSNKKVYLQGLSTEGQGLPEYPNRMVYKKTQLNIPFGGGIKYALSDDIHLSAEVGIRKLFTDYLDDVSTTYVDENILLARRGPEAAELAFRGDELKTNPVQYPPAGSTRGGAENKDWYYFTQLGISFRMSWFDNGEGNGSRRRKVGCPTKVY